MMKFITCVSVAMGIGVLALPVLAHHSDRMYDLDTTITLEGVVKEFQYTNPHSWLLVDVENEDGTVTTWGFEGASASNMLRAGVRPGDLAAGTRVTVSGHPMRDGRPAAEWITTFRQEDGKELNPRGYRVE